jgi:hypothetical protein
MTGKLGVAKRRPPIPVCFLISIFMREPTQLYRSGKITEPLLWYEIKDQVGLPGYRPVFTRVQKNTGIKVSDQILQAAPDKV